uniref:Uncharacterized protein n=1 Tax=Macaca fascicularis TaxID=9541 RepID=A0A7N9CPX6_MACFA
TKSSDRAFKLSQCEVTLTETLSGSSSHHTALCGDGDRVGAARACPANSPPGDLEPVIPTPTTPLLCHPCGWCLVPSGPAEPHLSLCLSTTAGTQQFRRPSGRGRLGKGQEGGRRSRPQRIGGLQAAGVPQNKCRPQRIRGLQVAGAPQNKCICLRPLPHYSSSENLLYIK